MPHGFAQSHIGERRLPHVPYELESKTHVYHLMWKGFLSQPPISRYCSFWLCLTVLLNLTSGRDTSHMCLTSLSPRHMCSCVPLLHACHLMWEGFLSQPLISRYCPVWLCLTVLLNPTLGRDTSHMCLISLSPRHMWD